MGSVWIRTRPTKRGKSFRVEYQPGGREAPCRYGGSFKTQREAKLRRDWLIGELAAQRMPNVKLLVGTPTAPTVAEAAKRWQASRIDAAEATVAQHRSAVNRMLPVLGTRRVDELAPADVAELVAKLHADGKSRES